MDWVTVGDVFKQPGGELALHLQNQSKIATQIANALDWELQWIGDVRRNDNHSIAAQEWAIFDPKDASDPRSIVIIRRTTTKSGVGVFASWQTYIQMALLPSSQQTVTEPYTKTYTDAQQRFPVSFDLLVGGGRFAFTNGTSYTCDSESFCFGDSES